MPNFRSSRAQNTISPNTVDEYVPKVCGACIFNREGRCYANDHRINNAYESCGDWKISFEAYMALCKALGITPTERGWDNI